MVTKHTRELWPYEPKIMTDDEQEAAYIRLLAQEAEPKTSSPLAWCVYGLVLLLAVLGGLALRGVVAARGAVVSDFLAVYRIYRRGGHGVAYCLRTAWRIAVRGADF